MTHPQDLRPYLNLLQAISQIRSDIMPIFYKEHLANVFIHLELDFHDGRRNFQRFHAICAWATSVRSDMRVNFVFSTQNWHSDLIQRFQYAIYCHIWNLEPHKQPLRRQFQASESKPAFVMPPGFAMQQTRAPSQLETRYLWITGPLATTDWSRFQFDFEANVLIDVDHVNPVFWSETANNGGWVMRPFNNDVEVIELDSEDEGDRSGNRNQPVVLDGEENLVGRSSGAGVVARRHEVIELD